MARSQSVANLDGNSRTPKYQATRPLLWGDAINLTLAERANYTRVNKYSILPKRAAFAPGVFLDMPDVRPMSRSMLVASGLAAVAWLLVASLGFGQIGPRASAEPNAPRNAVGAEPVAEPPAAKANDKPLTVKSPYRHLAPGVLISVDPMRTLEETVSWHDVVGLLAVDGQFDWAKEIDFRRDVWVLKFQFKPMRMIWVDVPQPSGYMQRKPIWYLVYVVTNTGKVMHPVQDVKLKYDTFDKREVFQVQMLDRPTRFVPEFLLEGHQHLKGTEGFTKFYPDRVIPVAMGPIRMREDPNRKFLTSVEMCRREIAVGESLWGVATWEDVDPRIVRFSVHVFGLTNAYQWKDAPGQYKPGESTLAGRRLYRKVLTLNFWRPGDRYDEHEAKIRYGVPGEVDYQWVYR